MNRISRASPVSPNAIWMRPASTTAGRTYSAPRECASGATTSATEPAAAVTIAGRPPSTDITNSRIAEDTSPTRGLTPATMEKDTPSGTMARVVTTPASDTRARNAGEPMLWLTRSIGEVVIGARADPGTAAAGPTSVTRGSSKRRTAGSRYRWPATSPDPTGRICRCGCRGSRSRLPRPALERVPLSVITKIGSPS